MPLTAARLLIVLAQRDTFNPNAPLLVPGLQLWYKADAILSKNDNDALSTADVLDYSGNARHSAVVTDCVYKASAIGTRPAIRFNGTSSYIDTASFSQAQPISVYLVFKEITWSASNARRLIDGATVNKCWIGMGPTQGYYFIAGPTEFGNHYLSAQAAVGMLMRARYNGASSSLVGNGAVGMTGNAGANTYSDGMTLGSSGNQAAGFFANIDLAEICVYSGTLSAANELALFNYFNAKYALGMTKRQVICDGDSLTDGHGVGAGNDYPAQMHALLGGAPVWWKVNLGVGGQTIQQMETDAATQIDPTYNTNRIKNILSAWGGTNDIIFGADDTTTYNRIVTYCTNRRAAGWKVVISDIIARGNFTAQMNTYKASVNSQIAANWTTFADAFVQLSADSRLQNPNDTTYYDADTVHLTTTGYGVVASLIAPQVSAL